LESLIKTDSPVSNNENVADKIAETENRLPETNSNNSKIAEYDVAEVEKIGRKSAVNLAVGTVFGFLMGLFYFKKKR
jgi:hypothetical protein